jgi:TPR repeat protein
MRRVAANDPVAMREIGMKHYCRDGDYERAFEYLTKAAELNDAPAHNGLSIMYREGEGVEKDEKRGLYHLKEAAIAGHTNARYDLGCYEGRNDRSDRAVKLFIIATNLGHYESIQALKGCYKNGLISKEDFATALRAHHAAVDAAKSPQRDAAETFENFRASQQQTSGGNT